MNGDRSVKITKLDDNTRFIMFGRNWFECELDKQYTASINIRLINSTCRLNLMVLDSEFHEINRVILNINSAESYQFKISINSTIDTKYIRLLIGYYGGAGGVMYLDNFSIIAQ